MKSIRYFSLRGHLMLTGLLIGAALSAKAAESPTGKLLPIPDKSSPIIATITASLDVRPAMETIRAQSSDNKTRLAEEIAQRLKTSSMRLNDLKPKISGLTEIGKSEVETGLKDAEIRKEELEKRIKTAIEVSSEDWEMARAELAASYAFYVEAIARVEIGLMKTLPAQVQAQAADSPSAATASDTPSSAVTANPRT